MSPSKLTKYCACHAKWPPNISQKFAENRWNVISNARPIRDRSETVPRPFPSVRNPPRNRGYFSRSGRAFCFEKYNISRSGYLSKFHQVLRLPRKVTLDLHQVLRLPRKVTLDLHQVLRLPRKVTLDLHQVLRLPRKVTLDLHQVLRLPRKAWSSLHMKRHLQCAEQQMSPSKLTKYCACHAKWPPNISQKFAENSWNLISNARPIRDRSETVSVSPQPATQPRLLFRSGRTVCIEKYNISRSGYLSKFHQILRLPRKVTLELHQVLRLPRKVTLELHQVLRLPRKLTLELHQVLRLPRKVTLELHQVLRLPRKVTLDLHQVLRLPHRMTRRLDPRHIWNVISNARRNKCHPPNSPNTAPATQNDHPTSGRNLRKTAETSFPMRGRSETVPRPFPSVRNPPLNRVYTFSLRSNGLYWKIQHFAFRLSFQISPNTAPTTKTDTWTSPSTAPTTQSDTWTSPSTAPTTKTDTWTSPSTAPTTKSDTWPSPSTAPATQNDSQAWSSSHMKRHFQCAQKQMSPSKLTKYCACHAKWPSNIWQKFAENSWNVISNARPIRDRSETVSVSPQPATQPRLLFALRTNGLYWTIQHFALRLSFQISPSPAPTTQSDTWTSPSTAPTTKTDTWTSPSTAPTTKSDTWPSPSTAPATQNDSRL